MSIEPLPSLDRSTLRERALEALRAAILSGQYRPGDHLGEVELAGRSAVQRGHLSARAATPGVPRPTCRQSPSGCRPRSVGS